MTDFSFYMMAKFTIKTNDKRLDKGQLYGRLHRENKRSLHLWYWAETVAMRHHAVISLVKCYISPLLSEKEEVRQLNHTYILNNTCRSVFLLIHLINHIYLLFILIYSFKCKVTTQRYYYFIIILKYNFLLNG